MATRIILFFFLASAMVISVHSEDNVDFPGDGEGDARTLRLIKKYHNHKRYTYSPPLLGGGGLLGSLFGGLGGGYGGYGGSHYGGYGGNPYGHGYGYGGGSPFIGGHPVNPGGHYRPGGYPPGYGAYQNYPGGYGGGIF